MIRYIFLHSFVFSEFNALFNCLFQAKPDSPDQHYVPTSKLDGELTNQKNRNSIEGQISAHGGGTQASPRQIGSETSPRTRSRVRSITPDQFLHANGYD